jgi:hypothetical protein
MKDVNKRWYRLCWEHELAKNYYALASIETMRSPIVDRLLPSLLYMKAVAILDHGLAWHIEQQKLGAAATLASRINLVATSNEREPLRRIMRLRHKLAHSTDTEITWQQLGVDKAIIHAVLFRLAAVGPMPQMKYYAERSVMRGSTEPGIAFEQAFEVGVKDSGNPVVAIKWVKKIHNS